MTEAAAHRSESRTTETAPQIHYQVSMFHPQTHLFEVTLHLKDYCLPTLDLKMPVWTPGSYLVREYAKNLQDFATHSGNPAGKKPLAWGKLAKNHWQVQTMGVSELTVNYRIFANELSVRTNHLDATHGYFNGAALFFRIPGFERQPYQVTIIPPNSEWQITTALPPVPKTRNTYLATDFDTLVDSPFEVGCHNLYDFEVLGKPHQLAIWGEGNFEPQRMIADISKIIAAEAKIFGGLPYEQYIFLLHLSPNGYGGLEHKDCCSLLYSRFGFRSQEKYNTFMELVAHEFFHLWNVKRIRPQGLEVFDYDQENYTPSLWFCEGTTSYYDKFLTLRAGIYDSKTYLQELSKDITRLQTTPGRKLQPLSESSFDAWVKLYRQDANSPNSQISYYLKGAMVSLLLDLLIRSQHNNQRSLDNVMLQMWQQFGKDEIGYTPEQLQEAIESVAGVDLADFFARFIDGTEELPFNQYLEPFGLQLIEEKDDALPYLGIRVNSDNGRDVIKVVEAGSPAQLAGIDTGDELLAIDGIRVTASQLSDRLKDYQTRDTIEITLFHQDELRSLPVTLAAPRATRYYVMPVNNPSKVQQEKLQGWLGVPIV
jgi:predicted metalloprotease with PDZ domain